MIKCDQKMRKRIAWVLTVNFIIWLFAYIIHFVPIFSPGHNGFHEKNRFGTSINENHSCCPLRHGNQSEKQEQFVGTAEFKTTDFCALCDFSTQLSNTKLAQAINLVRPLENGVQNKIVLISCRHEIVHSVQSRAPPAV